MAGLSEDSFRKHLTTGLSLNKALHVERGAVVSFVGGGGKTTAMFRLAAELSAAGQRVLTTTTTHLGEPQVQLAPASLLPSQLDRLGARLDQFGHCLVVGLPDGKGKLQGITPSLVADLHGRSDIDVVLVEADGSRGRPFKAPAEYEPVVPAITTTLVPIVGLDVIGQPLDAKHVHRHDVAASLAQLPLGSPITVKAVAGILVHPNGGAKQRPLHAKFVPLLNKADDDSDLQHADLLAEDLLASSLVDAAIICSMRLDPPVREVRMPVAGIVLAAGKATRYGCLKQILPWEDTTLVARSVQVALAAGLEPVIVVLGYQADRVEKALAGLPVQRVINPDYEFGQSSSLKRGLDALPVRSGAAIFLLADQPRVTSDIVRSLVKAHRHTLAPICAPVFAGQRGNPVLFAKNLFPELKMLEGDTGGRPLCEKYRAKLLPVPASDSDVLQDIDTPEDYRRASDNFED